jgi:hypothetical protein
MTVPAAMPGPASIDSDGPFSSEVVASEPPLELALTQLAHIEQSKNHMAKIPKQTCVIALTIFEKSEQ